MFIHASLTRIVCSGFCKTAKAHSTVSVSHRGTLAVRYCEPSQKGTARDHKQGFTAQCQYLTAQGSRHACWFNFIHSPPEHGVSYQINDIIAHCPTVIYHVTSIVSKTLHNFQRVILYLAIPCYTLLYLSIPCLHIIAPYHSQQHVSQSHCITWWGRVWGVGGGWGRGRTSRGKIQLPMQCLNPRSLNSDSYSLCNRF